MTPLELYKAGALTAGELAALQCACERGVIVGKGGEPELLLYVRYGDAVAPVSVGLNATVEHVREAAAAALSLTDADSCTLTLGGETLNLQSLCSDTNISSECTLQLERSAALELWRLYDVSGRRTPAAANDDPVQILKRGCAGCLMVSSREYGSSFQYNFVANGPGGYLYFFVMPSLGPSAADVPAHSGSFFAYASLYYGWDTTGRRFCGAMEGQRSWGMRNLGGARSWCLRACVTIDPQEGCVRITAAAVIDCGVEQEDGDDRTAAPAPPSAVFRADDRVPIPTGQKWRAGFLCGSSDITLAVGPNELSVFTPDL